MTPKTKQILDAIPGWLSNREAELLYAITRKHAGNIVEIGSFKGRSTAVIAQALIDSEKPSGASGRVYAIDPHVDGGSSPELLKENLVKHGVDKQVDMIVKTSEEAHQGWTAPVDFLWIDGDHSGEMVEKDFLLWEPHLKTGGVIAFHDATFNFPGLRRVVSKYIFRSKRFKNVGFADNLVFATKCKENTPSERVANLYNLFLKNLVTLSAAVKPPRFIKELAKPVIKIIARSRY